MLISHILIGLLAIACGIAVSAGTFAFILVIGVVPRMIKKNNMGNHIFEIENSIVFGVMVGAIFSVFEWEARFPIPWMAHVMVAIYGLAAGIIELGHDCHGIWKTGWFDVLLFLWVWPAKVLVKRMDCGTITDSRIYKRDRKRGNIYGNIHCTPECNFKMQYAKIGIAW